MTFSFRRVSPATIPSLSEEPDRVRGLIYGDDDDEDASLYIDKAWHGMHYLLTGEDWGGEWPFDFLLGGEAIGEDLGYGPARMLTPAETAEVAAALDEVDSDELRARFDPEEMTDLEIYPPIWDRPLEEDDSLGYVIAYFEQTKRFIRAAADAVDGLLMALT